MSKKIINTKEIVVPVEVIQKKIYLIRGHKVMLDADLASLYGVTTKRLKEQVKRNMKRFPKDFMFELTWEEIESLRSQNATLNKEENIRNPRSHFATLESGKNIKYLPYAFTEPGIAMLSSVLNSERAIEVNIQIIRVFIRLKEIMISHKDLAHKIEEMEKKYDGQFKAVFATIRQLMTYPDDAYKRTKAGFIVEPHKKHA